MKRLISLFLSLCVVLSTSVTVFAQDENAVIKTDAFSISGTEYYYNMDVISSESQMDYLLNIQEITFSNEGISVAGEVEKDGITLFAIEKEGIIFKSMAKKLSDVNGMTAIFVDSTGSEIISCIFEETADVGELFPVNAHLSNTSVLKIAIKYNDTLIYFEGKLPESFNYSNIYNNFAASASAVNSITLSQDVVISEEELVQNQEVWKHSIYSMQELMLNPQLSDNLEYLPGNNTMQLMDDDLSNLASIPENVFKQAGVWNNAYNSDAPQVGYYAETFSVSGTNNYVTYLLKWEYLYNECGNIPENLQSSSVGSTGIKIIASAEYTYYAERDSIELTNYFIPYRIKNCEVEMGLQSDEQILISIDRIMQANGAGVTVDWISILGLLPLGTAYSTAAGLFASVEYYSKDIATSADVYQNTAAGQINVYGKLIRGHKLTADDRYLIDVNDKMIINFSVCQPGDLTRTTRYNKIANKYKFDIYQRNGFTLLYTNHVYNVDETRISYYFVE